MNEKSFDLRLPEELHLKLKIQAAREGMTMNNYILAAIREKIERETK